MVPTGMESLYGLRLKLHFDDDDLQKSTGYNKIWFYVDLNLIKTIKDLQSQLLRRFKMSSSSTSLQLFLQEFLLMPDESIAILKNEDLILIKRILNDPNDEHYVPSRSKRSKKSTNPHVNDDCGFTSKSDVFQNKTSPKRGITSHELTDQFMLTENMECSSSRRHKSKKSKKNKRHRESEERDSKASEDDSHSCKKFNNDLIYYNSKAVFSNTELPMNELGEVLEDSSLAAQKRKRLRHRKRKRKFDEHLEILDDTTQHENKIVKTTPPTFITPLVFSGGDSCSKKSQHIRFDDDNDHSHSREETESTPKRPVNGTNAFKDKLDAQNITNGFDSNHPQAKDFEKKIYKRKTKMQTIENVLLDEEDKVNEIQSASQSVGSGSSNLEQHHEITKSNLKSYDRYDNLEGPPRIGDTVAFQELIMAEDYSPVVSEYRVGKVQAYDSKTQLIEIELSEELTLIKPNGKFEVEEDEEETEVKVKKMTVNLKEMLNPKLIL